MNSYLITILLLLGSNVMMTLAWYGHLKLQEMGVTTGWPLLAIIVLSWGVAFFEYCLMVPANRIGFEGNGGPFSLMQLKVLQECITLVVFVLVSGWMFRNMQFSWNHLWSALCLIGAVYFAFKK